MEHLLSIINMKMEESHPKVKIVLKGYQFMRIINYLYTVFTLYCLGVFLYYQVICEQTYLVISLVVFYIGACLRLVYHLRSEIYARKPKTLTDLVEVMHNLIVIFRFQRGDGTFAEILYDCNYYATDSWCVRYQNLFILQIHIRSTLDQSAYLLSYVRLKEISFNIIKLWIVILLVWAQISIESLKSSLIAILVIDLIGYIYCYVLLVRSLILKCYHCIVQTNRKLRIEKVLEAQQFSTQKFGGQICTCCMYEFGEADAVVALKCSKSHTFHRECLQEWFKIKLNCPVCRKSILTIDR